jgi:hypothetical protein
MNTEELNCCIESVKRTINKLEESKLNRIDESEHWSCIDSVIIDLTRVLKLLKTTNKI